MIKYTTEEDRERIRLVLEAAIVSEVMGHELHNPFSRYSHGFSSRYIKTKGLYRESRNVSTVRASVWDFRRLVGRRLVFSGEIKQQHRYNFNDISHYQNGEWEKFLDELAAMAKKSKRFERGESGLLRFLND